MNSPTKLGENSGTLFGGCSGLPVLVRAWDRNAREVVRVALDKFNGRPTINVRVWYRDGGDLKPSKSGITLSVKHIPALAESLNAALARAGELGLLDDGGEQ